MMESAKDARTRETMDMIAAINRNADAAREKREREDAAYLLLREKRREKAYDRMMNDIMLGIIIGAFAVIMAVIFAPKP